LSSTSTGGITRAPISTPNTRAACCFHGVASTSWPVFRSCRLLLAIDAMANTTEVRNSANAVSALPASGPAAAFTPTTRKIAATSTARMPTPDSGLFDEPIRPAM
jgi:hypothetical protein